MKGYFVSGGYMGLVGGSYQLFATESDYLEYLADMFETATPALSSAAAKTLDAYRWPRNYLQLREVSERLYILVGTGTAERAVAEEVLAQEDVLTICWQRSTWPVAPRPSSHSV